MAKKRRKVRRVARTLPRAPKARVQPPSPAQAEHILGLAGGIIIVLAAIISMIQALDADTIQKIISLVAGILIVGLTWSTSKKPRVSAIGLLVLSLLTFFLVPQGFFIGPIFVFIGAVIVLVKAGR